MNLKDYSKIETYRPKQQVCNKQLNMTATATYGGQAFVLLHYAPGRFIPSFLILALRVLGFMPSFAAAPFAPSTFHPEALSIIRICSRSTPASSVAAGVFSVFTAGLSSERPACNLLSGSACSKGSICTIGPRLMMTARSRTFSNSLTFPGQEYSCSLFMASSEIISLKWRSVYMATCLSRPNG